MLSRKEKNELKKQIGELLKRLTEDVSRKEKNDAKREIGALMKRLNEQVETALDAGTNKELDRLIAGEFDELDVEDFLAKITEISEAIGDIEPIKDPAIKYVEKRLAAA